MLSLKMILWSVLAGLGWIVVDLFVFGFKTMDKLLYRHWRQNLVPETAPLFGIQIIEAAVMLTILRMRTLGVGLGAGLKYGLVMALVIGGIEALVIVGLGAASSRGWARNAMYCTGRWTIRMMIPNCFALGFLLVWLLHT